MSDWGLINDQSVRYIEGKDSMLEWQNQGLIREAVNILKECDNFLGFKFIRRTGNQVADTLAVNTRKHSLFNWRDEMPNFIGHFILLDKLNTSRRTESSSATAVDNTRTDLLSNDHTRELPCMTV